MEGNVFQLFAHVVHAHAAGERRIDFHRFFRDPPTLVLRHVVERAHVVQTVGQLDQKHADVIGNRKQKLAEVFCLLGLLGNQVQALDLCQAFDQLADFLAEQGVDLGPGRVGVLDRVMQQGNGNGGVVQAQVREDRGNFKRMGEIRVARRTRLGTMLLHGIDVSLVEQGFVRVRIVARNSFNEFVLTHHGRNRPWQTAETSAGQTKIARSAGKPRRASDELVNSNQTSSVRSGGTRPSRPRRRSSSDMRSNSTALSSTLLTCVI